MTTTSPTTSFTFKRNLPLLNESGSLGFELSTIKRPDVLTALAKNTAFPAGDIELADLSARASTAKPIEFARGSDKVSFVAHGGVFAGFGVYRTGARLLAKLGEGANDFALNGVEFAVGATSLLSVLRWGYAADAKASGAIALAPAATVTVDAGGEAEGLFAVIRRLPAATFARDVIQMTADSWVLPRQISSIDQVDPGTWIVADVSGGINIKVGAQVGFDFNWIREAQLGGLSGDIGLRLQTNINAAIGFATSGRCAVIVSRDSDAKALRVRFFRLKTRELDLSVNATLGVQARDTLLPDKVDDFIAAVFDTHGQQILSDLKAVEHWIDSDKPLSELLANAGIDGAESLIAKMAGTTPAQLQQQFDAVHAKVVTFIDKWHQLPHRVSSALLKLVEEKADLSPVKDVVTKLTTITPADLQKLLDTQLQRIDFFSTPVGRILESISDRGVLALAGMPLDRLHTIAGQVLSVLDGSLLEDTLKIFQQHLETELHLDKVFSIVDATDFAGLDALLKRKLANFLGQKVLVLEDLENVRRAIRVLLHKRDEYYAKALEALHRKYTFSFTASSQSTTTDRALFDGTFDFSHDPASVSGFLQSALRGRLDELLAVQPAQVTIAAGQLSHGISRQTHVDVSLPFMDSTHAHLNESLATIEAVPHEGGLLMKLKASDTVKTGNERKSTLSLALALSRRTGSGVRFHQDALELNYSLLFAKRNMQAKHVRAQVGPAIETFFRSRVRDVDAFITLLDRQTEAVIPNGPNLLGNGLIALDVSLSEASAAAVGGAWIALPTDRGADVYSRLSVAIQASLKQNIFDSVFGTPDGYTQTGVSRTQLFIGYCALVPRAQKGLNWFWDWPQPDERRFGLRHQSTVARMRSLLTVAQQVLQDEPQTAKHFKPEDAEDILSQVDANDPFLNSLLAAENEIVQHAFKGGVSIAAAAEQAKPSEAIKALARFGSSLTEAFNANITSLLGPGLQTIGTRVLLDASRAIDQNATSEIAEANAMLSIEFVKPSVTFDAAALLAAGHVPAEQLALADRVVSVIGT